MTKSNQEESNSSIPYKIEIVFENSFRFTTSQDVNYKLSFYPFNSIIGFVNNQIPCFSFDFEPDKKTNSKNARIGKTIISLIIDFFKNNDAVLFYLCNPDGKQHVRNYLFNKWYDSNNGDNFFIKEDAILTIDETNRYYFSIIFRKDSKNAKVIIESFKSSINELVDKP
ncbi:MAG: hypothetical protein A2033_03150 [Bacteroidetes bacterium GWA2_31_9]|nr:MAG: hypothetical protein A2033_03150 [Bacteroidetes bacterium GWA2_31_9]